MSSMLLALDFGGTKHAAAIAQLGDRQWRSHQRALAPPSSNAMSDLDVMRLLIKELLNGDRPAAIGVSFGGPVDFTTGTVRLSHHVPGWEMMPLSQMLAAEYQAPVWVDNDANVAALGEHRFGAGQGCPSLLYITVSTGVGGGWILNDQPWRGAAGMAGEIGHMMVDPAGPVCLCGKRGCVERLASGPYMAEIAKAVLSAQPERGSLLRSIVQGNLTQLTAIHLSQAADQGDALAQEILEKAGWALGVAIGNVANLINPQRFVLGGGVTKSGELFWQTLRQVAKLTMLPEVHAEIVSAALGDDAPLWGAIALAADGLSVARSS